MHRELGRMHVVVHLTIAVRLLRVHRKWCYKKIASLQHNIWYGVSRRHAINVILTMLKAQGLFDEPMRPHVHPKAGKSQTVGRHL